MTILQAAGISKVPREHEWRLGAEMRRATRGRSSRKSLEVAERSWKSQLDIECA
jgi:hypothetical protein